MASVSKTEFVAFMFEADTAVTLNDSGASFTALAGVPYTTSQSGITATGTVLLMKRGTKTGSDVLQCFSVDEVRTLA
jgi:hypothetical protein